MSPGREHRAVAPLGRRFLLLLLRGHQLPSVSAKYSARSSVERVNSRPKECRRLERHCFRGLAKVTTHALLSVAVMQATALAHLAAGDFATMRWSLGRVA